jgi:hypothetical protein
MSGIMHNILSASAAAAVADYWVSVLAGGGTNQTVITSTAFDPSGDIVVCGYTRPTALGTQSAYLAKYSAAGSIVWQKTLGANPSFNDVKVAASGNIYVCGATQEADGAARDGLLAKYDSSGALQWQKSLSNSAAATLYFGGLGIDSSENIYAAGSVGTFPSTQGVAAKFDTTGAIQWQRSFSYVNNIRVNSCTVTSAGVMYICGDRQQGVDYLVTSYSTTGTLLWDNVYIQADGGSAICIFVDASNNLYIGGILSQVGENRGTVLKLTSAGAITWQQYFNTNSIVEQTFAIFATAAGDVYSCAYSSATANTGLMFKYNSAGTLQWQRTIGSAASDNLYDIIVDSAETIITVGFTAANGMVWSLPGDGTKTGTYNGLTYAAGATSTGSDTFTVSSSGGTSAASTHTVANTAFTASTPTLTNTLTDIP